MNLSKIMVLKNDKNIPSYELPYGYHIRFYQKGEENLWAVVETLAGEFESEQQAIDRFYNEFSGHEDLLTQRLFFLENDNREVIGTVMAWMKEDMGRVHWLGIVPAYQGKGLSKCLLSHALQLLTSQYDTIYLKTQSNNEKAISLYTQFGFEKIDTSSI